MLVEKYHKTNCDDKELLVSIDKAIKSSLALRSKKELIDEFIARINVDSDVYVDWKKFVVEQEENDLKSLIEEENLNDEETRKFLDNAFRELEKVRDRLWKVGEDVEKQDTKQYDFVKYLIEEEKDMAYLEYTFKKMPSLVNVKDKEEVSLFRNIIKKYLKSIKEDKEEETLYFNNLLSLILAQNSFNLSAQEKRDVLDLLYSAVDKMSIKKSIAKMNKDKINWLNTLIDTIKGEDRNITKIEFLASKYNISIYFDENIIEKAKLVRIPDNENTRSIVDDYIITIDKENAIEIDDALSCRKLKNGNYLLGVHIASVLGYFPYHSDIVREAIGRNKSIYLSNKYQEKENDFHRTIPATDKPFQDNDYLKQP